MKKYIFFFFWAPLFSLFLIGIFIIYLIHFWAYTGPDLNFEIRPGERFAQINYRLHQQNLISSSKVFHRYVKFNNSLTKFKVGVFRIKTGITMPQILFALTIGPSITRKVTIPEGKNMFEIGKILEEADITSYDQFVKAARDKVFLRSLKLPHNSVEGHLYPETYQFSPKTSAQTVIRIMVEEHNQKTKILNMNHPELSPYEILILASIVEKETGAANERPMIAGVFLNRLKKRMRLQSDPTTIYGIYESFKGNLTKFHLSELTPYNTYKISGLPVGPIANPGVSSIQAVLNPAQHNFLFFVSRNDGTHLFTPNYKDHLKGVKTFQQTSSNRKGKSWRDLKQ